MTLATAFSESEHDQASQEAHAPGSPTSFAILFIAANNQLQCPSAEDDVLSSAGRDQIAADNPPNFLLGARRDFWVS